MLISCRLSIVGLQILLLTHIAHSFVLLTANVDDVKKIARKFVSDSLAEKIADFIARATETLAQMPVSEENEINDDTRESSQVSAENRLFNVERHGDDSQIADAKSKEEIVFEKVRTKLPRETSVEKKRHRVEERSTTQKPKKEPKPLHGKSRYIVQTENRRDSLATERGPSKTSEEENFNYIKESIKLVADNFFKTPHEKTENRQEKKNIKEMEAGTKDDEMFNVRANKEILHDMKPNYELSRPAEESASAIEQLDKENEKQFEKAATDVAQHEIVDNKNTDMVPTNEHLTDNDEFYHDENTITRTTDKVLRSGSRNFGGNPAVKEEKWWEKDIPAQNQEGNMKEKSWF